MHNKKKAVTTLLPLALASAIGMTLSQSAVAEIMLYDKDDTTFTVDGYFNTFYVSSDVDRAGEQFDRDQSRVKMGFLPNYIGFNFGKQLDDLKVGDWVVVHAGFAIDKIAPEDAAANLELIGRYLEPETRGDGSPALSPTRRG